MFSSHRQFSPQQRRVGMIVATVPIMCGTGFVLYKRLVLGQPQRLVEAGKPGPRPEDAFRLPPRSGTA
ncbi:hypothetical protein HDZ31DRAFT_62657 [Schizophyllum fasciatum]